MSMNWADAVEVHDDQEESQAANKEPAWGGAGLKAPSSQKVNDNQGNDELLRSFPKLGESAGKNRGRDSRGERNREPSSEHRGQRDYDSRDSGDRRDNRDRYRDSDRSGYGGRETDRYRDNQNDRGYRDSDRSGFGDRRDRGRDRYDDRNSDRPERSYERRDEREEREERPIPELPKEGPWTAYVGNLPYHVDEAEIGHFFEDNNCHVETVRIMLEHDSNRSKGFGYVEFCDLESLRTALTLRDPTLKGFTRVLKIDVADKRRESDKSDRYRDRQRGDRERERPRDDDDDTNWRALPRTTPRKAEKPDDRRDARRDDRDRNDEPPRRSPIANRPVPEQAPESRPAPKANKPNPFGTAQPRDEIEIQRKFEEDFAKKKEEDAKIKEEERKKREEEEEQRKKEEEVRAAEEREKRAAESAKNETAKNPAASTTSSQAEPASWRAKVGNPKPTSPASGTKPGRPTPDAKTPPKTGDRSPAKRGGRTTPPGRKPYSARDVAVGRGAGAPSGPRSRDDSKKPAPASDEPKPAKEERKPREDRKPKEEKPQPSIQQSNAYALLNDVDA